MIKLKDIINEGKITKTFKFPSKSITDIDEIDADFSRQGIQSNPDFKNNTITVTGDESKIKKIVKFHKGIQEYLNEATFKWPNRTNTNLDGKFGEGIYKFLQDEYDLTDKDMKQVYLEIRTDDDDDAKYDQYGFIKKGGRSIRVQLKKMEIIEKIMTVLGK